LIRDLVHIAVLEVDFSTRLGHDKFVVVVLSNSLFYIRIHPRGELLGVRILRLGWRESWWQFFF